MPPTPTRSSPVRVRACGAGRWGATPSKAGAGDATELGAVVRDVSMVRLYEDIGKVAQSALAVLVSGETGVGKEIVARAIHDKSPRRTGPFVSVNCAAIPRDLVESELFGIVRGAFTGADASKPGYFEQANGGTIFLDEIGELPSAAQSTLLRVLETHTVRRVGGNREERVDFRVVAATHCSLDAMVAEGRFRKDLLFRLNAVCLEVPPLRERPADIDALIDHFLELSNRENGRSVRGVERDAREILLQYDWPGNVRELRNTIDRAAVITDGDLIAVHDLPMRVLRAREERAQADRQGSLDERVQAFEVGLLWSALVQCEHNQTRAAGLLKMPRRTLVHKLRSLQVAERGPALAMDEPFGFDDYSGYKAVVEQMERQLLEEAMGEHGSELGPLAEALGIAPHRVSYKLRKHNLRRRALR